MKKGAALCSGAKILCKEGTLRIGHHVIVGANAVVTKSVPPYEIWGVPAKRIGYNLHVIEADGMMVEEIVKKIMKLRSRNKL